jgi:hypothetical protein
MLFLVIHNAVGKSECSWGSGNFNGCRWSIKVESSESGVNIYVQADPRLNVSK